MKHPSAYLDWYIRVSNLKYDLRSSGIMQFNHDLSLGEVDMSVNYAHGNPETARLLAEMYKTRSENVFVSSEGTSGQNARVIRCLAERNEKKKEAIVEYPTYEPLLRQVQEHFPRVKRLERRESDGYRLDADALRKVVSERTAVLALTNPHAPSGVVANRKELSEIMAVANEYGFFVLCDEIYAEFDRHAVPTIFSVEPEFGIVTTSFTKAYGLGGLKLGVALAKRELVDELYLDVLNTVGNSPNVVQMAATDILAGGREYLERHKQKWIEIKAEAEKWFEEKNHQYFPNRVSVTYWVKLPIKDTHKWVNGCTIPRHSLAVVPGAFFIFKSGYKLEKSNMIRLGLGAIKPDRLSLLEALGVFEKAINT